jgi:hypothetical protein
VDEEHQQGQLVVALALIHFETLRPRLSATYNLVLDADIHRTRPPGQDTPSARLNHRRRGDFPQRAATVKTLSDAI